MDTGTPGTPSGPPESPPRRPRLPSGMRDTTPGWEETPDQPGGLLESGADRPADIAQAPPEPEDHPGPHTVLAQPPPGPDPGPPIDPQRAAKIIRQGRIALWLGGAALVLALCFFYLSGVVSVAALIIGIRARRAATRAQMRAPGAVPGIVMGAAGLAFSLALLALLVYLWGDLQKYTDCQRSANTISDENVCKDTFGRAVETRFHMPAGSVDRGMLP